MARTPDNRALRPGDIVGYGFDIGVIVAYDSSRLGVPVDFVVTFATADERPDYTCVMRVDGLEYLANIRDLNLAPGVGLSDPSAVISAYLTRPTGLVPANGGSEQPFVTRAGRRVLYVWDVENNTHRYLDLGTDILLPRDWSPLTDGTSEAL